MGTEGERGREGGENEGEREGEGEGERERERARERERGACRCHAVAMPSRSQRATRELGVEAPACTRAPHHLLR